MFKNALPTAFEKAPEFYRLRFRNLNKNFQETYSNFAFRLQKPFVRWIRSEKCKQNLIDCVGFAWKSSVEAANQNTAVSQSKSKCWFDKKTAVVSVSPGAKVLVLLPLKSKPLQAKNCGPYEILEILSPTPDRRKSKRAWHVKLMKSYEDVNFLFWALIINWLLIQSVVIKRQLDLLKLILQSH